MSRTTGSNNTRPVFMSKVRIKKKAVHAIFAVNDLIDASLLNHEVKPLVDYDAIHKALENLNFLLKN